MTILDILKRRTLDDCTCEQVLDLRTGQPIPHTHLVFDKPESELPWENR